MSPGPRRSGPAPVGRRGCTVTTSSSPVPDSSPGRVARGLVRLIGWYQGVPRRRAGSCRFVPTCSSYAVTAIGRHGALRGSWLAFRRLGRCRPFGSWGYDPVPGEHLVTDRPSVSDAPPSERAA
ncbi:MAG: membrane protein insertion efficiency factor YidD [Acidimicrobiales bacterium]